MGRDGETRPLAPLLHAGAGGAAVGGRLPWRGARALAANAIRAAPPCSSSGTARHDSGVTGPTELACIRQAAAGLGNDGGLNVGALPADDQNRPGVASNVGPSVPDAGPATAAPPSGRASDTRPR